MPPSGDAASPDPGSRLRGALRRFVARLASDLRPAREDAALAREVESHLRLLEDEFRRRGQSPDEAARSARIAFGGVERAKELHRQARSFRWLDEARRDVRYAMRRLAGDRAFSAAVAATIGIAIGGAAAIYSLVDAVLLQPLPYRDPARLVVLWEEGADRQRPRNEVAPINYALLTAHNDTFTSIAAVAGFGATLDAGGRPEKIGGRRVTRGFFDVLGVSPAAGRAFRADEDMPNGPRVAIVSHELWRDRLAADPASVGGGLRLDGKVFQIVGVMPPRFQFLDGDADVWVPMGFDDRELAKGSNYLTIVARLRPDVGVDGARARLDSLARRLAPSLPEAAAGFRLTPVLLHDDLARNARRPLLMLSCGIGALLLIACANIASLLLARAGARQAEMALRRSLGATRGRLVRQLLTECLVLCGAGLVTGLVLARSVLALLTQLVPPEMLLFAQPALDADVVAAAALVALLSGLVFGLAPVVHLTGPGPAAALKAGGRGVAGPAGRRGVLIVSEVALTLILVVVAGLFLKTLYNLRYAGVGFEPAHVLTLRTVLPPADYPTHVSRVGFYDAVLDRVARLPGVTAVGYATSVPLAWKGATTGIAIEGQAPERHDEHDPNHRQVSAGYLQAIRMPLLRGRYFTDADRAGAQPVAIVNDAMARRGWPGQDPIGRRFRTTDDTSSPWLTVVGVVGDVRQMGLDRPPALEMYVPYRQFTLQPWFAPRDLVVRAADPLTLVTAVTREIHAVDPTLAVSHVGLLDHLLDEEVAARRLGAVILVGFAAFALILVVVGVYGVMAYFVVQHTPEIGVRVALGARTVDVIALVAGRGIRLAAIGIAVGLAGAWAAARFVSTLLYGVAGTDPATFGAAAAGLLILALAASYGPARRASRLDPVAALRQR
jgi:putative ABC transport system permease protein